MYLLSEKEEEARRKTAKESRVSVTTQHFKHKEEVSEHHKHEGNRWFSFMLGCGSNFPQFETCLAFVHFLTQAKKSAQIVRRKVSNRKEFAYCIMSVTFKTYIVFLSCYYFQVLRQQRRAVDMVNPQSALSSSSISFNHT